MRFVSLFSGLEGASLAWPDWECAAVCEIDPAACAVLAHRWPDVPNLGNIEQITEAQIKALGPVDLVVFGSPCQDVSIAGKRAGMKGARSGLFFTVMRIVRWSRARFALWENVPGVFSDDAGRGFASVVGEMAGVHVDVPPGGWANAGLFLGDAALVEWCVLDAQFFGVPQRRRRVFALRDIGDWQNRAPILLERESLCGHPAPSREAGEGFAHPTAPSLTSSGRGVEGGGVAEGKTPLSLATAGTTRGGAIDIATACNAHGGSGRAGGNRTGGDRPPGTDVDTCDSLLITHALRADGFDASKDGTGRGTPLVAQLYSIMPQNSGKDPAVAFNLRGREDGSQAEATDLASVRAASGGSSRTYVAQMAVRRLTPMECERLQGVPDGWTLVPRNGKPMADGPRYKMLGNGFAVPVLRWIGKRIAEVLA